jgi:hypothetical protein
MSTKEIKAAAQFLVKKFHPSKYPGNSRVLARVKKIKQVYTILSHPQKRAAYDAVLAKKTAEMAPNPPSSKPQKKSLLVRQKVAKKSVKVPPKALPQRKKTLQTAPNSSKSLEQTSKKTQTRDEQKISTSQSVTESKGNRSKIYALNYFFSLFFISFSIYFLFITPSHLTKIVLQFEFLQDNLWCIKIGLQAILGLSLLLLLYTLFQTIFHRKTAPIDKGVSVNTPPSAIPPIEPKRVERVSKASTITPQTQEAVEQIVQRPKIHWLKHITALLLILIPLYLAFEARYLKQLLLQSDFWQDKLMYVNWSLQGLFLLGCLIWAHTLFRQMMLVFNKVFHREPKQNDENSVTKNNKNDPKKKKGVEAPKKRPQGQHVGYKAFSHKYYGLAYLIGLLLMAIPTYLLFIDPKFLKRIVVEFDLLQDRLFYISLTLQAFLAVSLLILLITFFQHLIALLKKRRLKKLEASDKIPVLSEQVVEVQTSEKTTVKQSAIKTQQESAENRSKSQMINTKVPSAKQVGANQLETAVKQSKTANKTLSRTTSTTQSSVTSKQRPVVNKQRPQSAEIKTANASKVYNAYNTRLEKQTAVSAQQKSAVAGNQKTTPSQDLPKTAETLAQKTEKLINKKTPSNQHAQEEQAKMLAEKILYRADIHGIGSFKAILFISLPTYFLLTSPDFLKAYLSEVDFLQEQLQYMNITLLVLVGLGVFMLLHALWHQFTTTLMITSQQIVARFGLLSRKQIEMTHEQFERIKIKQGLLGYLFGFGTLKITGMKGKSVGGLKINISHVASPKQFEKRLMRIIKNSAYHQI